MCMLVELDDGIECRERSCLVLVADVETEAGAGDTAAVGVQGAGLDRSVYPEPCLA